MSYFLAEKKYLLSVVASILVVISLLHGRALAEESNKQKPKQAIVQQIGNIRVGSSHDPDVVEKYGEGLFVENEGHGGGRYYANKTHSYTFHIEIGVDKLIEDVEIFAGDNLPQSAAAKPFISQKLPDIISVDHGIKLGMKRTELISILGQPQDQKTNGNSLILEYHTSMDEDSRVLLYYDAYYEFRDARLIRIRIHDGC